MVQLCWPLEASPKPMHPMQMRDTFKPELPNCVYFIRILHSFCPLSYCSVNLFCWALYRSPVTTI